MKNFCLAIAIVTLFAGCKSTEKKSDAITQDERMEWWRDAHFGMFIHWGLYAIPAGEWKDKEYPQIGEWIMKNARIPVSEYSELAQQFNPGQFDADAFVKTAKDAGMKYIVITSKHHDGFAMFKSAASSFNVADATPYHKDIIKALSEACQKQDMKLGFYYSQSRDWHEPNGLDNDWDFPEQRDFQKYLDEKVKPQLTELLTNYGPIGLIWFDTPLTITTAQAASLKALVRKLQPSCIISGRLGGEVTTDYSSTRDNAIPPIVVPGDWEVPATLNNTWGFKRNDNHWKSSQELTRLLFDITAKGGNYLLNVGPTAAGVIPSASVDILRKVGDWMKVNHEAIYGAGPNPFQVEFPWGNITTKNDKLFLGVFHWPQGSFYLEGLKNKVKKIYLLADSSKALVFHSTYNEQTGHNRLEIDLPSDPPDSVVSVVVTEIEGSPEIEHSIFQQKDGTIFLPGALATAKKDGHDVVLSFTPGGGGAMWKNDSLSLSWQFTVDAPGTFDIDIITAEGGRHGSPTWNGGQLVQLSCGSFLSNITITDDGRTENPRAVYWQKVHTKGGKISLAEVGEYTLTLKAINIPDSMEGFSFRSLMLVRKK
jgi:alpha-L-fucosidase